MLSINSALYTQTVNVYQQSPTSFFSLAKKLTSPQSCQTFTKLFRFSGKFSQYFFSDFFCNKSECCFLYSCTNPIFQENPVPEIYAKMLSANRIPGFYISRTNWQNSSIFGTLYKFMKINQIFFEWAQTKNSCGHSGLAISQE